MSDLTLEELDELTVTDWNSIPVPSRKRMFAAARAHLEPTVYYCPRCSCSFYPKTPQPPQQREDDRLYAQARACFPETDMPADTPAPSSTVEPQERDIYSGAASSYYRGWRDAVTGDRPSPDAGLVERLREPVPMIDFGYGNIMREAAAALEAKDALIAQYEAIPVEDMEEQIAKHEAILEAKDAEIERWEREAEELGTKWHDASKEIERLREALEEIRDIGDMDPDERIPQTAGTCSYIARAALGEKP
jgi:archaellum component FlaC